MGFFAATLEKQGGFCLMKLLFLTFRKERYESYLDMCELADIHTHKKKSQISQSRDISCISIHTDFLETVKADSFSFPSLVQIAVGKIS